MNEIKKAIIKYTSTFIAGFFLCFILFYTFSPNIGGYNRSEKILREQFSSAIDDLRIRNDGFREYIRQLESFNSRLGINYRRLTERESELRDIIKEREEIIISRERSLERANSRLRELESIISKQTINYSEALTITDGTREGLREIINELRELSGK